MNNIFEGRDGADTIRGGSGADIIYGGFGKGIVVDMNVAGEDDTTLNKGQVTQDGHDSYDLLYGIEKIIGSKYADIIIGDTDDNVNNIFEGRDGADTIRGGSGADIIYGGFEN